MSCPTPPPEAAAQTRSREGAALINPETLKALRTRAVTFAAKAAELRARAKVTRDVTARLGFLTAAQSYEMMARGAALEADREANATAWKDVPNPNWD